MPFEFRRLSPLDDVILIEPQPHMDDRGWFAETFKASEFSRQGIPSTFPQDNHVRSGPKHVLRGLHYQLNPMPQGKLVRCVVGEVFDVAVDIRKGSPNYGRWASAILSAKNQLMSWVPPGFAHGLLTMKRGTEVQYKVTAEFSAQHDRVIRWDDPEIGITWPSKRPVLSAKDANAPLLADAENSFFWRLAK